MSQLRGRSPTGVRATLGVVAVAVLCCAGPALLAGGTLAGLGGLLRSPWLIGVGALVVLASATAVLVRRHRAPARTRRSGRRQCTEAALGALNM